MPFNRYTERMKRLNLSACLLVFVYLPHPCLPALANRVAASSPQSIQERIDSAYRAHRKIVRIPAGTYTLDPPAHGSHLQFHDLSDFEIDARGVLLLLSDNTRGGIEFRNCRNVTFRGATIRYITPPFTQGTVTAIAPDGSFYDVQIDRGYPVNLDGHRYFPAKPVGYLFNPKTRLWKPGTYDLNASRVQKLAADRFRFYWDRPAGPALHPVSVGDPMAFRGEGRPNLTLINSAKMRMIGITILNAGDFAVWEHGGDGGNSYDEITVTRGPKPEGASAEPLFSGTADGFHSTDVREGPVVEHSRFESMPDDGIAIQGTYSFIFESKADKLVINQNSFRPGDPIRIYDAQGRPAAEAIVRSVAPLPQYRNTRTTSREIRVDNTEGPYFTVTLDHAVKADFDYLAENPAATGAGYVLRYNTILNHRARGMLLKASDGLVEHNTIDGSTMGGIVVTPEFWWNEAGFSRNVVIRDNVIRHVAYAPKQLGGVVIAALNGPTPVAGYGHRHIVVEDNTLEGINGVNLLITSSKDVVVRNNLFLHAQQRRVGVDGAKWGEDPGALIYVTESEGVRFENNRVRDLGPFNRTLVESTPTASVTGAKDGVVKVQ